MALFNRTVGYISKYMKKINTIILTVTSLGLLITGYLINGNPKIIEFHRFLSVVFTMSLFIHIFFQKKSFSLKPKNNNHV